MARVAPRRRAAVISFSMKVGQPFCGAVGGEVNLGTSLRATGMPSGSMITSVAETIDLIWSLIGFHGTARAQRRPARPP